MKKIIMNPDLLKLIALLTMTIDHVSAILFKNNASFSLWGRCVIGRISLPIFAFLLTYHLAQKQIFKKYMIRLVVFASLWFICGLFLIPNPLDHSLNILYSFLLAVISIYGIERLIQLHYPFLLVPWGFYCSILSFFVDYHFLGLIYFFSLYFFFKKNTFLRFLLAVFCGGLVNFPFGKVIMQEPFLLADEIAMFVSALITFLLLCVDMDKPYRRFFKHWSFFYLYYVLHLILLYSLSILL